MYGAVQKSWLLLRSQTTRRGNECVQCMCAVTNLVPSQRHSPSKNCWGLQLCYLRLYLAVVHQMTVEHVAGQDTASMNQTWFIWTSKQSLTTHLRATANSACRHVLIPGPRSQVHMTFGTRLRRIGLSCWPGYLVVPSCCWLVTCLQISVVLW